MPELEKQSHSSSSLSPSGDKLGSSMADRKARFHLRSPTVADAPWIWRLVRESTVLDPNSCYLYLLLCRDFADTCVVAEGESGLAGFVTAYRPPAAPETLFVWQVAVSPIARRHGLALRMLNHLLSCCDQPLISAVEATIAPSNLASRRLFESLARQHTATFSEVPGFEAGDFIFGSHEAEPRIRVGPLVPPETSASLSNAAITPQNAAASRSR